VSVFRFGKGLVAACALAFALVGGAAHAAPAMWEVRDHDTRIYLFGAMHVLAPNVKWRTRAFDRAYAQADKVWFETRADADPAEVRALVDRYGVDPDRSLTEKLPPRTVATLRAALERDGGSLDRVDRLRPWAAAMMLSVLPMTQQGASVAAGADATVTRQARAAEKEVATFETVEQQIRLFASLPETVEVQYLDDVAAETLSPPRNGVALQSAWLHGDMDRLGPLVVDVMKRDGRRCTRPCSSAATRPGAGPWSPKWTGPASSWSRSAPCTWPARDGLSIATRSKPSTGAASWATTPSTSSICQKRPDLDFRP
jgi:uncharacterized protein YbaP (TraB family)